MRLLRPYWIKEHTTIYRVEILHFEPLYLYNEQPSDPQLFQLLSGRDHQALGQVSPTPQTRGTPFIHPHTIDRPTKPQNQYSASALWSSLRNTGKKNRGSAAHTSTLTRVKRVFTNKILSSHFAHVLVTNEVFCSLRASPWAYYAGGPPARTPGHSGSRWPWTHSCRRPKNHDCPGSQERGQPSHRPRHPLVLM